MPDRPLRRRSGPRRKTASGGLCAEGGPELADGMRRSERPVDGHAAAPEWMGARGGWTPAGLSGLNGEGLRFRDDGACGGSTAFLAGGSGRHAVCPPVPEWQGVPDGSGCSCPIGFSRGKFARHAGCSSVPDRGVAAARRDRARPALWRRPQVPGCPADSGVCGPTVHAGCPAVCIGTSGAVDVSGPFISTLPAERSCAVPAAAPRGRTRP